MTLDDGAHRGRGEASGVYYLGDTAQTMVAAIEAARGAIEAGIDRAALQKLLPPGGARNAVDCALWELEAQRLARCRCGSSPVSAAPKPLVTTFTLGADDPAVMAAGARKFAQARCAEIETDRRSRTRYRAGAGRARRAA